MIPIREILLRVIGLRGQSPAFRTMMGYFNYLWKFGLSPTGRREPEGQAKRADPNDNGDAGTTELNHGGFPVGVHRPLSVKDMTYGN